MKITTNLIGMSLDTTKEFELLLIDSKVYGYNCDLVYGEKNNGDKETRYNCTEIHYRYDPENERIAFESDIHHTGSTRNIEDLESIHIYDAFEKHSDHWGD